MARPKTTETMSIRLPIGTLARLDKLAKEKYGRDNARYKFVHDMLVGAASKPTTDELEETLTEAFGEPE